MKTCNLHVNMMTTKAMTFDEKQYKRRKLVIQDITKQVISFNYLDFKLSHVLNNN